MTRRTAHMTVMVAAVEKAGRALIRDFGEVENLQVSKKGPGDFVSTADHKSEKILREELAKARPTFGFLMEEGGEVKGDGESRWIIDPLDGTTNFLHGIPHWSITIAMERNGEIIAGITHDPIKDELFWVEKGTGAFVNARRLRVPTHQKKAEDILLACYDESPQEKLVTATYRTRRMGSAALDLAYVAAGRLDAHVEAGLQAWDVAAGSLMVKEAGGYVTDYDGGKDYISGRSICAAGPALQKDILKLLKPSHPLSRAGEG